MHKHQQQITSTFTSYSYMNTRMTEMYYLHLLEVWDLMAYNKEKMADINFK